MVPPGFEPIGSFQRIFYSRNLMESVYVTGTHQERVGIIQPAIDLYDLSKNIQYRVTQKESEIANDLHKHLPSDRSQEMKKMFGLD